MVLGGEGYSRIRPGPAWPRGAVWHYLGCHLDLVPWGCPAGGRPALLLLHVCSWAPLVAFILV